jgi:hypothetical protein
MTDDPQLDKSNPLSDEEKPPKPPIEDMPPEHGIEPPPYDKEEDVHDDEFLSDQDAADDDTIDNEEQ